MLVRRLASGLALVGLVVSLTPAVTPACITKTANVTDLYMSLDSDGTRKRSEFTTDTRTIHCIAEVANHRPDATFFLRLRSVQLYNFDTNQYFDSVRDLGILESHPAPADGVIKIDATVKKTHPGGNDGGTSASDMSDPDALPYDAGRFVCEVFLDKDPDTSTDPDMTTTFNVTFPGCPGVTIVPSTLCFGFFTKDTRCPEFGVTSTEPATCRCDKDKGWDCPM